MGFIILMVILFFIVLSVIKKLFKLALFIAAAYFICLYFFGFNLIWGIFHFAGFLL
jgi:hypothetical protein